MGNESFDPKYDEDEELLLLVRRVWFSFIFFVLKKDGLWPDSWKSIILEFSKKSPALLISKKAKSLDADLASCLELQIDIPDEVLIICLFTIVYFKYSKSFGKLSTWTCYRVQ